MFVLSQGLSRGAAPIINGSQPGLSIFSVYLKLIVDIKINDIIMLHEKLKVVSFASLAKTKSIKSVAACEI